METKSRKVFWMVDFVTCLVMYFLIMHKNIGNLDEIWIFSYAKNLSDGLALYKDISLCVTPLSIHILSLVMKIFGTRLWTYRILSFLIYGLCYEFGSMALKNRMKCRLVTHVLYSIYFISMYEIMIYEYNIINAVLLMLIIYMETRRQHNKKDSVSSLDLAQYNRENIILGVLAGLVFMTKQSTGLVLLISMAAVVFINKETVKGILVRIIGFMSVAVLYFSYLYFTGALPYVLDFTVFGIGNFTQNLNSGLIIKTCLAHMEIGLIMVFYIYTTAQAFLNYSIRRKKQAENQKLVILCLYMLASVSIVYPLFDYTHFSIALIAFLPYVFSAIDKLLYSKRKTLIWAFYGLTAAWLFWNVLLFNDANYSRQKESKIKYFEGLKINRVTEDIINSVIIKVQEYEEAGFEVYILDASAQVFLTPMDIYHKYYDLLLSGNTGTADTDRLIREICNNGSIIFYVKDDKLLNYQMPKSIKDIIRDAGMCVIDECGNFDIYGIDCGYDCNVYKCKH